MATAGLQRSVSVAGAMDLPYWLTVNVGQMPTNAKSWSRVQRIPSGLFALIDTVQANYVEIEEAQCSPLEECSSFLEQATSLHLS